ncbi:HK97 family phage prohead protease [Pseudomonas sp. JS3066]|uniref:HK97 family phage prohead protease n=1 Tax=Pseudomonas sp. JS3066 TaxID=3090665 RepID=UPI002E7ABF0B|nr:HK97 family phage prohead protease [Pseudomonas sp. JS3066]WVK91143.1 HK97 family phage prohead protease [Pseudomonas sp. JS3066]
MERKTLNLEAIDVKFDAARPGFFSGYASKFGGVDSYGDTILPGAYKKTLKKRSRPIQLRWNHWGPVIGKWLKTEEDEQGLYVEGELTPGHSVAQDVYASLKHGAVTGLSIGFRPVQINDHGDGRRDLKEIDLIEISVVESPADLAAQIGDVKSAIDQAQSLKEIEAFLRDAGGFSRADAVTLVARIKSLARGEREPELKTAEIAGLFQHFQFPQL